MLTNQNPNLKKGTTKCPKCNNQLHFEVIGMIRIVRDGLYNAYCPIDKRYFNVKA